MKSEGVSTLKTKKQSAQIKSAPQLLIKILQWLFLGVIFLAPLFHGLYSEESILPFAIVIGLMIWGYLYFNKKDGLNFDIFDLLGISLCVAYFISIFNAADLRLSYLGFMRYSAFFAMFYLARRLFRVDKDKLNLTNVLLLALTISAVIGIIQKIVYHEYRMSGTFTYANSFAIMLAVAIIIIIMSYITTQNRSLKFVYAISSYICLVSLLSTGSRGGLFVYGISLLLLIFLTKNRLMLIVNLVILHLFSLAGLAVLFKFSGLSFFLLFTFVGIGNTLLMLGAMHQLKLKKIALVTILIAIIGSLFAYINYSFEYVPLSRLTKVNLSDIARLVFYKDALKIFAENPLIGSGANSWPLLYYGVQTYPYVSKEVHSSIFRLLVEIGLVGIIIALSFVGVVLLNSVKRIYKREATEFEKGLLIAVLAMLVHSTIDFDLAFSSFVIYLFTFMGLLAGAPQPNSNKGGRAPSYLIFVYIWFMIISFSATSFMIANQVEKESLSDVENGKLAVAKFDKYKRDLKTAIVLDPLNSKYRLYLGQVLVAEGNHKDNAELLNSGLKEMDKALLLAPKAYKNYIVKGNILYQLGNYEESVNMYEKVIALCPFRPLGYNNLSKTYIKMAIEEKNLEFVNDAITVYKRAYEQVHSVPERYIKISANENVADRDPYLNYNTGIAFALKGEYDQSLLHLEVAKSDKTSDYYNEVLAWEEVISGRLGGKNDEKYDDNLHNYINMTLQGFDK
jgi:O-antigen ligase